MKRLEVTWVPVLLLAVGSVLTLGLVNPQRTMSLRAPLSSVVPARTLGHEGRDVVISSEEQRVAGMDSYLMRDYGAFSLYVGYYESQTQGNTIHSPKNCLPGAGWEPLTSTREAIPTENGPIRVNRYLLQRGEERALVLYWYQGRGRTQASEYLVKWDLLRDSALRGRSEEALVRVIVPVTTTEDQAYALATKVARSVVPALKTALPS